VGCAAGSEAFSSKNPALNSRPAEVGEGFTDIGFAFRQFTDEPHLNQQRNPDEGVVFGKSFLSRPASYAGPGQESDNFYVVLGRLL
jgi:hypothetical protein